MAANLVIENLRSVRSDTTQSHLTGSWLTAARVVWMAIALLVGSLFVIGLPDHYAVTLTRPEMLPGPLTQLGLTPTALAVYNIILDILTGLIFFTVALLLFVRRSNELMA